MDSVNALFHRWYWVKRDGAGGVHNTNMHFLPPWPKRWLSMPQVKEEDKKDPQFYVAMRIERESYIEQENVQFANQEQYLQSAEHVCWETNREKTYRKRMDMIKNVDGDCLSYPTRKYNQSKDTDDYFASRFPEEKELLEAKRRTDRSIVLTAIGTGTAAAILTGAGRSQWFLGVLVGANVLLFESKFRYLRSKLAHYNWSTQFQNYYDTVFEATQQQQQKQ